jgi:uncharacterized lipoprotein YmbA
MIAIRAYKTVIAGSILAMLAACGATPPNRYFLLEPTVSPHSVPAKSSLTVLVNEVILREYLTRKEIVRRDREYEVSVAEFRRWAEPLQENMTVVVAENLSRLLQSDNVIPYSANWTTKPDYELLVEVYSYGADARGDVVLYGRWTLLDHDGAVVVSRRSRHSKAVATNEAADTVAAMSEVLGNLSGEIAAQLEAHSSFDNDDD